MIGGVGGSLVILGYIILINPYIWLLRTAVKIPTKRMHKADCYEISNLIKLIASRKGKKSRLYKVEFARLDRLIFGIERNVKTQNIKANCLSPKYRTLLLLERTSIYKKMLYSADFRKIIDSPSFPSEFRSHLVSLADRIDKLSANAETIC